MLLLDRGGTKTDAWTRTDDLAIGDLPQVLVPWENLPPALAAKAQAQRIGALIPNSLSADSISPHLPQLALIAVMFPSFSDGRGFSLAKAIRRAGFGGTLRASGPLIPDQFDYALACGFDEIELPESSTARQTVEQWRQAVGRLSQTYQRGYRRDGNILEGRRQARAASTPS
ncbi:DUF934 domain-containing protein [Bosea sp. (in: a-proteobacteria)]|uniref:DUF934 domain-containing protein n=1 Tax=Bosea sp. (in: a-proteobacteria) TaxID=1871050 RepID=UPI0025BFF5CE|nr:DUF934 domain-containing protein [Bosea sp. (in: a-proteobacteria)]